MSNIYKAVRLSFMAVVLGVIVGFINWPAASSEPNGLIALQPPSFVGLAQAQGIPLQSIVNEAGIAAYFSAGNAINLNNVRSLYRTLEADTAQYLLGSISVPGYDEGHDVHVYISSNSPGWVLAYYHKTEPTAKIFDWLYYDTNGQIKTKLGQVLERVTGQLGVSPTVQYYHFNYPNANKLMLIAETRTDHGSDSFQVNLPGNLIHSEQSWSLGGNDVNGTGEYRYDLASQQIGFLKSRGWIFGSGFFPGSGLATNTNHTITVSAYLASGYGPPKAFGGLALVYKGP
ncbi:MAG: hypothetical protein HC875_27340 [Anaerolineales bacterium]|nr:hypothetical protein [Anaerolineales bacterium]